MMPLMRSTVRIDDDLLTELKEQAKRQNTSLTRVLNRTLRVGIQASREGKTRARHKQTTFSMGTPRLDLDKALTLAADLEDQETLREMALRK
jgi:hypothetical protein